MHATGYINVSLIYLDPQVFRLTISATLQCMLYVCAQISWVNNTRGNFDFVGYANYAF